MLSYPQPPLTPFQVTLLPEQVQMTASSSPSSGTSGSTAGAVAAASSSSVHRAQEAVRTESWTAAASMLHSILDLASDYHKPQVKFAAYSPEQVMRSVRGLVDDDRCKELVELLQGAVRDYAEKCVAAITELRQQQQQQQQPHGGSTEAHTTSPSPVDVSDMDREEGGDGEDAVATLHAVQVLALYVTYFERLQHGIAELASVWVYATQWCSIQTHREVPRSLVVAATQEASEVFRSAPELFEVALQGYCAVLKAELAADTATLGQRAAASFTAAATASCPAGAAATSTTVTRAPATTSTEVAQLKAPASAADAKMDPAALALLACPPSVAHLTTPLRRRLLFLFTQLTREAQQYNALVEPVVVRLVRSHFEAVSHRWWAEELSAARYFELSEIALKHADTVHQQFLHSGTIPLIEDAIQATLIGSVGAEVLKRDFTALMEQEQFHALRLAWRLLSSSAHVRSAPAVVGLFREYLLECGHGIMEELVPGSTKGTPAAAQVAARERPFLAVRHVIGLLEHGSRTVEKCFHECEKEFKVALHEALQTILEAYPNAFSEQLAAYQDAIMKEVEVGHVPVSLSVTAAGANAGAAGHAMVGSTESPLARVEVGAEEDAGAEREEGESEEGHDSPLRRPRAETSSSQPALPHFVPSAAAAPALRPPALTAAARNAHDEEEAAEGNERVVEAPLGTAALRHAAPLPAEAKEATPVLRRIAFIYSYHPKKDLFEAAYWRDFARRCLHPHRKVDVTAENAFIFYLRDICGLSFTSKFEGMLTDLESSSQLTAQYKTWCQEQDASPLARAEEDAVEETRARVASAGRVSGAEEDPSAVRAAVETHLLILAQSFWPKYAAPSPRLYVPPSLQHITKTVEKFYAGLFPNRHLTWQHPLAHATLRAQLTPHGPVLSLIGTYTQCVVLMRLDALHDRGITACTVRALCEAVGLDCTNTEVLWSLQGLCHPRCRLLLTRPQGDGKASPTAAAAEEKTGGNVADGKGGSPLSASGQLEPQDEVRLNLDFTSNTAKVRIPLQTRARTTATAGMDGTGRGARTADNGGHLVEVAIVSCLKARRTVSHADLVAEINARLPFTVSVPMLKKSIEKMIERGFMVRGKDSTYTFSA